MSEQITENLAALLVEHTPIVRPLLIECRGCAVSFGTEEAFASHIADAITARWALVSAPNAKTPTPALVEAAYVAQDDLSKTPEAWAIRAAAEVIEAYIAAQAHTEVHVLGHPKETAANA